MFSTRSNPAKSAYTANTHKKETIKNITLQRGIEINLTKNMAPHEEKIISQYKKWTDYLHTRRISSDIKIQILNKLFNPILYYSMAVFKFTEASIKQCDQLALKCSEQSLCQTIMARKIRKAVVDKSRGITLEKSHAKEVIDLHDCIKPETFASKESLQNTSM